MKAGREQIAHEEAAKAKQTASLDLEAANRKIADGLLLLKDRELKLEHAQKAEADFLKKQRELDDQKREFELTIQKRLQTETTAIRDRARAEADDAAKLKVAEKDQLILGLHKQIDVLRQKAEQGSQQLQGEVFELELEQLLRQEFPIDSVAPVPKGEFGGDVVHAIINQAGHACGTILWESKRTKAWSDGWLTKLRKDQRVAKAEICVLVSHTLPKDVELFDIVEGVWVVSPRAIVPVATVLRHSLLQLKVARQSAEGQQMKTELMYAYLTGPQFRQRVEAIIEAFTSMREDLHKERQAITRQWAKREKQIESVMIATVGMWGDLQGISGKSLQELDGLDSLGVEITANSHTNEQAALPGL